MKFEKDKLFAKKMNNKLIPVYIPEHNNGLFVIDSSLVRPNNSIILVIN